MKNKNPKGIKQRSKQRFRNGNTFLICKFRLIVLNTEIQTSNNCTWPDGTLRFNVLPDIDSLSREIIHTYVHTHTHYIHIYIFAFKSNNFQKNMKRIFSILSGYEIQNSIALICWEIKHGIISHEKINEEYKMEFFIEKFDFESSFAFVFIRYKFFN